MIGEQQLQETCETGDLMLFRSKNFKSKLTRGITSSKFGKGPNLIKIQIMLG